MNERRVFFKEDNGVARIFYSKEEMNKAGFTEADGETTEENFNANGGYVRIINGKPVVGKTEEEKAEEERQEQIAEIQARFNEIDRLDGPRPIREAVAQLAESAGLDTSYLNRHEAEADSLRHQLAELQQSA